AGEPSSRVGTDARRRRNVGPEVAAVSSQLVHRGGLRVRPPLRVVVSRAEGASLTTRRSSSPTQPDARRVGAQAVRLFGSSRPSELGDTERTSERSGVARSGAGSLGGRWPAAVPTVC